MSAVEFSRKKNSLIVIVQLREFKVTCAFIRITKYQSSRFDHAAVATANGTDDTVTTAGALVL